ncbi:MAG: rhodanese-like domain-containing protein [Sandaracinaceae bacterium]|nr:rhodanese-like domain-containing protein [Sandaracinaceae bacterium]
MARIPEAPLTRHGYYELRPLDVLGRTDLVLIDVRPLPDLLGDFGHIEGVHHRLGSEVRASGLPLPKDTPVVLVCNNGHESRRLVIALVAEFGFTEVFHLVGGMLRWNGEERAICTTPTWKALP